MFSSEALGFSAGNIRVVTVLALRFSTLFFQFYTRYVRYSYLFFVVFALWFVGQVALRLGVGIWFLGLFSGGFDCVLGVFRVSVAPLCLLWAIDSSLG